MGKLHLVLARLEAFVHRRAVTASQGKVEFGPRAVCDPGPIEGFLVRGILFKTHLRQSLGFVQRAKKFSFEMRAAVHFASERPRPCRRKPRSTRVPR